MDSLEETIAQPGRPWLSPVAIRGVYVNYVGDCFIAVLGAELTADGFDAWVNATETAIRGSPMTLRVASMLHVATGPWWSGLSLSEKTARIRQYTSMSSRYQDVLNATVPTNAQVLTSAMARAAIRAGLAFQRPVNPIHVPKTAAEGYRLMQRALPNMSCDRQIDAHRLIVERYAPDLFETVGKARAS